MSRFPVELVRTASASKNIDSRFLNAIGIQVARTLAAHSIYALRQWHVESALEDRVSTLRRDGLLIWNGFLPDTVYAALRSECLGVLDSHDHKRSVRQHGPNRIEQVSLLSLPGDEYPSVHRFLADPRLSAVIGGAEKRAVDLFSGHRSVEQLLQGPGEEPDTEASLHVDTFFHTHKAWLYLDDVERARGAFVYVRGSHRLHIERLRRAYAESNGPNQGSRRIEQEELDALGLSETVVECPANTLVIANTAGYHRRTRGVPGQQRRALHLTFRFNPFWPRRVRAERWLSRRNPWVRRVLETIAPERG